MAQKKQHYVPRAYLKAWCDSNRPPNQSPYVWIHSLDGKTVRKKSPDNIFTENDFYTIEGIDGSRDLVLENGLSQLESLFARAHRNILSKHGSLNIDDRFALCAFTAAMQARTKRQRDHWRANWQRAADMMDKFMEWREQATPEQQAQMNDILSPNKDDIDNDNTISYEEVKELIKQPMKHLLISSIDVVLPILMSMQLTILETAKSYFITSDNPCCWFDPEISRGKSTFRSPGIGSPTIEISLPVSPQQLLYFTHNRFFSRSLYFNIDNNPSIIEGFNQRTALYADDYLVSNKPKPLGRYRKSK